MTRIAPVAWVLVLAGGCREEPPRAASPTPLHQAAPRIDAAAACALRVALKPDRVEFEGAGTRGTVASVALLEAALGPLGGKDCSAEITAFEDVAVDEALQAAAALGRVGIVRTSFARGASIVHPEASAKVAPTLVVTLIEPDGLMVGPVKVGAAEVPVLFARVAAEEPATQLVLKPARDVAHGRVIAILEAAKQAGLKRIAIAAP